MVNQSQERQPILPYPSRSSVTELTVAMIERRSGVTLPDGWPENEPLYLDREFATQNKILSEAIDGAIQGAEPGGWLSQELEYFERMIAEYALELLESSPAGRAVLDAIRASAIRERKRRESEFNGAE